MPSAQRLLAGLCLAFLAFLVSSLIIPLLPEGTYVGRFAYVNVLVGFICGWIVMGPRAGRGVTAAINNGLTGMAAMMFWGLFVHSTDKMLENAMRNRYDGPFEAIMSILYIGFDYATVIFSMQVVLTLLVGGVLSGLVTEWASRRWR